MKLPDDSKHVQPWREMWRKHAHIKTASSFEVMKQNFLKLVALCCDIPLPEDLRWTLEQTKRDLKRRNR